MTVEMALRIYEHGGVIICDGDKKSFEVVSEKAQKIEKSPEGH